MRTDLLQAAIFRCLLKAMMMTVSFLLATPQLSIAATEIIEADRASGLLPSKVMLTPNEKEWLAQKQTITVAVKSGWMPIEFKLESDRHRGLSIDYLGKIADLLQVDFRVVDYTENITSADADIISGVSGNSLKNDQFRLLTQPFLTFPFAIYTNKNTKNRTKINGLEDLSGSNVAVFKSGILGKKIRDNYPKVKLVYVEIADEAFDALESGTVDAYIGNEMVIDYHIAAHGLKFAEKVGVTPFTTAVSMAVRSDKPELASTLEKALIVVGQNNKDLLLGWEIEDNQYQYILKMLFILIIGIFSLVLFRFYQLKRSVKKQNAETQKQIWHQANFDHLTKLPNRHLLQNRLEQAKERAARSKLPIGILFIDLDHFKKVNDQSGHSVGDQLLLEAANRICKCVRSDDTTARFGGDEFIVVMADLKDIFSLENACQKILAQLEKPFVINGDIFYISASIGVTLFPDDSRNLDELLSYADQAMYEAKKQGRNRVQFFTESIQTTSQNRLSITHDIRDALIENQFALYYQPIVCLESGKILKAEALIRWIHPVKGMINPIDFISLAEESGFISELGKWVFNQAVKDLQTIRAHLGADFQLSINVSPYQFNHPEDLLMWVNTLQASNIPGNCIAVEITEGLLLDPSDEVIQTISALREHAIEFSIDDFGTGYSALAYLKRFEIDCVKIDKSFIQNLETNNYDAVLCEAIINMAHKLGIKVVAEGIETPAQKKLLMAFTCDFGQGYLFAKPQPLDQLLALMAKH